MLQRSNMLMLADPLVGIYKTYNWTKSVTINPHLTEQTPPHPQPNLTQTPAKAGHSQLAVVPLGVNLFAGDDFNEDGVIQSLTQEEGWIAATATCCSLLPGTCQSPSSTLKCRVWWLAGILTWMRMAALASSLSMISTHPPSLLQNCRLVPM